MPPPAKASPGKKHEKQSGARQPVVLVDGSGYIYRAYYALPKLTRKRDGLATGAVYGFCNMLQKLLADIEAAGGAGHLAVLFDAGRTTFRTEIYPEYKAHRPPPPDDLVPQFGLIRDAVRAFRLAGIEVDGVEADDLIASYAKAARAQGYDVVIVSSDKDLMQLVGEGVHMLDPIKNIEIGADEVRAQFGVDPDRMVDLQALAGDSTDNVPGIPGIGVKTAAQLLTEYGDLDALLARAAEIPQPKRRESLTRGAEAARMSRELVRLKDDVPLPAAIDALAVRAPDPGTLFPFLEDLEFGNLLTRLRARWGSDAKGKPGAGTSAAPSMVAAPAPAQAAEFAVVRAPAELAERVAVARAAGIAALHVEADGAGGIAGIAVSHRTGAAWFVPLAGPRQGSLDVGGAGEGGHDRGAALAALRPLFEDAGVIKAGHDSKSAVKLLAVHGIALAPVDDVMLLSFVLGGGRDEHGMEAVAARVLGTAPSRKETLGSGKSATAFADLPVDVQASYAGAVAEAVLRCRAALRRELFAERLVAVYEATERPLVPVLADMERTGILVDRDALAELSEDFARRMAEQEKAIHRLAKHEFNVGSPKQLGEVLFDEMGLGGGRRAKTGAWSTDAAVLEQLAAEGHELPEKVLEWRLLAKLKSTYTDTLGAQIGPDGRVHTTYAMAGAATGRLASSDPNLQNIPIRTEEGRRIRRAFVAGDGNVLVSADYSQIELRLLAHMAGIESLQRAFRDGVDIHALTASEVFGVPIEGMDAETRRRAKAINFGIIYGISPFGLGRQLGIPQGEAKRFIEEYFERYPGIRGYMDRARAFARKHGYVTTWYGRRVHIAGIHDRNHAHRSFSERAAINAPLQGSAADIMKRALVRVHRALAASRLRGARMLLSVHDELLFEVPAGEAADLRTLARRAMEGAAHLGVPLTVETGQGANWDQAH